ncbi:putative E3 ubiquitin-protein ligase LIN-2 [Oryza glaberrima]|uniref:putative E3 ubiquitin-protein ligase LIN-2 n=1 Tax=Oryza glaberrima TaxID=4538 RepID=UPI00224C1FF1|nr:putative E3 ubiquitin-protein ligase LIN-2 [Oryza glaberrima]
MAPPPSSLLRDLLAADGFRNRRKPPDSNPPAAPRTTSMPLQHRRPSRPARSQSDVLTRSRLRETNNVGTSDGDGVDAGEEQRTATRRSSASLMSARSYNNNKDSGGGAMRGGSAAAVPALDESVLTALISLVAGAVKRFVRDEGFRASLRGGCMSCLGGESNHRAVLDLRVIVHTVERAASEGLDDPRDLKRASLRLHAMASLDAKEADAVTAAGVPYQRLAACAHLYMSVISKLQEKDHSSAVHVLEAFCLAPHEARTSLLPALWDRLFRSGLSHLKAWRDRESATAASSDTRVKDVEKMFVEAVDDGTRALACYYRDWLLGRSQAMSLPVVPAPPSTVLASALRFSTSTSYDIGSDVACSSGSYSPAVKFALDETPSQYDREIEEEEEAEVDEKTADAESVFHECDGTEPKSYTHSLQTEENELMPDKLANEASERKSEDERSRQPDESTSYVPISDITAIDLPTLEFCEGPDLQSDTDGSQISIFATIPSDFLCPLTRQIFNRPVTIETGQTFERHAIVQWFDRGIRMCPITGQELESLSIPDINRVLKRLIDNWKSEHCKTLNSESTCPEKELTVTFVENVLSSECETSEKLEKARRLMAIGGIDFLLHKFHGGGEDEKAQAADLLLLCIRAEGSCRNYMAIRICNSSVVQLLHSEVISARSSAVRLLVELLCLKRREIVELFLRGLRTELTMETMNLLLEHLRRSPNEEQALGAVLLLHFDHALVEPHRDSVYREEAAKIITHSLRCSLSEENVVANTRKALLLLGGHFSFSGDLLAEDRMLKQAGFVDGSRVTRADSDAAVQDKGRDEDEVWLRDVTAALLGSGRRPFLEALSMCMSSPNHDLAAACLTTAAWLSRSLASIDAADVQLAAFSALIPRLKQRLAGDRSQAQHRVLASVTLYNFSKIPDCRALLMLLADGLRDHLVELAELTWTAGQLITELQE